MQQIWNALGLGTTPKPLFNGTKQELVVELFELCLKNDIPVMKSLIEKNANPNGYHRISIQIPSKPNSNIMLYQEEDVDDFNNTLLHAAATTNSIEMIDFVIEQMKLHRTNTITPFDIDEEDFYGSTALSIATSLGHLEIVQHLVEKYNANIHGFVRLSFISVFDVAILSNNVELVQYYINLNSRFLSQFEKSTIINFINSLNTFKFIVTQLNIDLIAINLQENGKLIFNAVESNNFEAVHYLITEVGIGVNFIDMFNTTPLLCAIQGSYFDMAEYLIEDQRANPYIPNETRVISELIENKDTTDDFLDYLTSQGGFSLDLDIISNGLVKYDATRTIYHQMVDYLLYYFNQNNEQDVLSNLESLLYFVLQSQMCTTDVLHSLVAFDRDDIEAAYNYTIWSTAFELSTLDIIQDLFTIGLDIQITLTYLIEHDKSLIRTNDVNYKSTHKSSIRKLLLQAVHNGDPDVLDTVLQYPPLQDYWNPNDLNEFFLLDTIHSPNELTAQLLITKYNVPLTPSQFYAILELGHYKKKFNKPLIKYLLSLNIININSFARELFQNISAFTFDELQWLSQQGLNFKMALKSYNTIHTYISQGCKSLIIIDYLYTIGYDINQKNDFGETPIHYVTCLFSSSFNQFRLLRYLIYKYSVDINTQRLQLSTPLHDLIRTGSIGPVKYLIQNGAQINIRGEMDTTPLLFAVSIKKYDIAKYLLQQTNCNVMVLNFKQQTILHLLIQKVENDGSPNLDDDACSELIQLIFDTHF